MAETFDLLGMANGIYGDRVESVEQYDRAIALLRTLGDHQGLISSLTTRVAFASPGWAETTYSVCEQFEHCSRGITEALNLARQVDSLAAQAYVEWNTSRVFVYFGEPGRGLAHVQESLRIAREISKEVFSPANQLVAGRRDASSFSILSLTEQGFFACTFSVYPAQFSPYAVL